MLLCGGSEILFRVGSDSLMDPSIFAALEGAAEAKIPTPRTCTSRREMVQRQTPEAPVSGLLPCLAAQNYLTPAVPLIQAVKIYCK